jgi:hypothetical protein
MQHSKRALLTLLDICPAINPPSNVFLILMPSKPSSLKPLHWRNCHVITSIKASMHYRQSRLNSSDSNNSGGVCDIPEFYLQSCPRPILSPIRSFLHHRRQPTQQSPLVNITTPIQSIGKMALIHVVQLNHPKPLIRLVNTPLNPLPSD